MINIQTTIVDETRRAMRAIVALELGTAAHEPGHWEETKADNK